MNSSNICLILKDWTQKPEIWWRFYTMNIVTYGIFENHKMLNQDRISFAGKIQRARIKFIWLEGYYLFKKDSSGPC
jgi:hypothetical protein